MNAQDYIKEGDGQAVFITRSGVRMLEKYIIKLGSGKEVSKVTGLAENTITKIKNFGTCAPDTWETLFNHMTNNAA